MSLGKPGALSALTVWVLMTTLALTAWMSAPVRAAPQIYSFGVLSQRSAVLTAQYWNPILDYVWQKAGVNLQLKITHTAPECHEAVSRGEYDFVYSNYIFEPANMLSGYRVILRPDTPPITGQIVTLDSSPIKTLAELNGKTVGFPSQTAFVGYILPSQRLREVGVSVTPQFGGNQEGIMAQLKTGKVIAAAVNSQLMQAFAAREGFHYRVLWESKPYPDIPIAVNPRVDKSVADAVQNTLAAMSSDPEGLKILTESAAVIQRLPPYGFVLATPEDYQGYVDTYRAVPGAESN